MKKYAVHFSRALKHLPRLPQCTLSAGFRTWQKFCWLWPARWQKYPVKFTTSSSSFATRALRLIPFSMLDFAKIFDRFFESAPAKPVASWPRGFDACGNRLVVSLPPVGEACKKCRSVGDVRGCVLEAHLCTISQLLLLLFKTHKLTG